MARTKQGKSAFLGIKGWTPFDFALQLGRKDVADQHPKVVAKIKELAHGMRAELGDSATKQKGSDVREPGRLEEGDPRFQWIPGQPIQVQATPE